MRLLVFLSPTKVEILYTDLSKAGVTEAAASTKVEILYTDLSWFVCLSQSYLQK